MIFDRLFKKKPPVILTQWGPVTEKARMQVAINMKVDPEIKARVENLLIEKLGDVDTGLQEAKRRYPEAYEED